MSKNRPQPSFPDPLEVAEVRKFLENATKPPQELSERRIQRLVRMATHPIIARIYLHPRLTALIVAIIMSILAFIALVLLTKRPEVVIYWLKG